MRKRKQHQQRRSEQAVERALKSIEEAGWTVTTTLVRFVARKVRHEREDESTTYLFESDYTIEGLAANVVRREREEAR